MSMTDLTPPRFDVAADRGSAQIDSLTRADHSLAVTVIAGADGFEGQVHVRQSLPISEPWFMLPGIFSGRGRQDRNLHYPQLSASPDPGDEWQQDQWDFALERMAIPLAGVHDGKKWYIWESDTHYELEKGALVGTADSEPQVGFGISWDGNTSELRVHIPAIEGPVRHVRNPLRHAVRPRISLEAGGRMTLTLRWHTIEGDRPAFASLMQQVFERLRPSNPPAEFATDLDTYAAIARDGLHDWHWQDAHETLPGYFVYTAAMDRSVEFNANVNRQTSLGWHFDATGFVGGFPIAYGLLSQAVRVGSNLDSRWNKEILAYVERLATEAPSSSGLFRTSYHPGKGRTINGHFDNGPDEPAYGGCWSGPGKAQARTTADACLYLAKLVSLLQKEVPVERWKTACINAVKAAMRIQDERGKHPQMYESDSGEALRWDGDGGLLWVSAMLEVASWTEDSDLKEALESSARRAGDAYAAATRDWWICGAPEDIGISPSSEDAGNALMAYGALYRLDGDHWLDLWTIAADYLLTWRKAYNVRFGDATMFALADLRTVGGDFASNHNNHLHGYAMNCLSELKHLSEVLGNDHYALRAEDHLRFFLQLLCRQPGQWNGQKGMLTEQFYTTDWSVWGDWNPGPAHVQKGTMMGFSHSWCINMVLLGIDEWVK